MGYTSSVSFFLFVLSFAPISTNFMAELTKPRLPLIEVRASSNEARARSMSSPTFLNRSTNSWTRSTRVEAMPNTCSWLSACRFWVHAICKSLNSEKRFCSPVIITLRSKA